MERGNTLSLTVMVIILAMLGLFVGYLLGNWFIQLVTGDANPTPTQTQTFDNKIVEEEIIVGDEDKKDAGEPTVPEKEEDLAAETTGQYSQGQLKGEVYVIQVGAFSNYNNACALQEELTAKGFQAVVTEGVPYKVQLGATNSRLEAEETEKRVESLGYDAFITH